MMSNEVKRENEGNEPSNSSAHPLVEPKTEPDEESDGDGIESLDELIVENAHLKKVLRKRKIETGRILASSFGSQYPRYATAREKAMVSELFDAGFTIGMFVEEVGELTRAAIERAAVEESRREDVDDQTEEWTMVELEEEDELTLSPEHKASAPTFLSEIQKAAIHESERKRRQLEAAASSQSSKKPRRVPPTPPFPLVFDHARLEEIRQLILIRNLSPTVIAAGTGIPCKNRIQPWLDKTIKLDEHDGANIITWYENCRPTGRCIQNMPPVAQLYLENQFIARGLARRTLKRGERAELSRKATDVVRRDMGERLGEWATVSAKQVEAFIRNKKSGAAINEL